VRLSYTSKDILGYRLFCGPYDMPDEASARAQAEADDVGIGAQGMSIAPAPPGDAFVFRAPAGDFGGSAAVSRRNGLTLFGATTVWSGEGDITYPTTWLPAKDLAPGCQSMIDPPTSRGFDLGGVQPLADADRLAAIATVWNTALPDGLWKNDYIFDAVVLLYPRTVGGTNPATAELVVLVNSGWLE